MANTSFLQQNGYFCMNFGLEIYQFSPAPKSILILIAFDQRNKLRYDFFRDTHTLRSKFEKNKTKLQENQNLFLL